MRSAEPAKMFVTFPVALVFLTAWCAGGCGGEKPTRLESQAAFEEAIQSSQPVLVDFYKGGCPTCIALDGTMDSLADQYQGKAVVAKFMLMKPYFAVTSSEIRDKYDIVFYPTVILFRNGQEINRWSLEFDAQAYRNALDQAVGQAAGPAGKEGETSAP